MPTAARFFLKVYDKTGSTLRQTIGAERILSVPTISREVNMPAADISIELALPWDDFGFGAPDGLNYYDLVEVYAQNPRYPGGVVVFKGFVTEVQGIFTSDANHIVLRLLPIESILGNAFYKTGPTNWAVVFSAKDVDFIMGAAIDDANAVQGATYFTKNLAAAGKSITATYTFQNHLQVIQAARDFLDDTWYWRTLASGQIDLQQFDDVVPDHVFTMGLDIQAIDITASILDVKNAVVVSWGAGPTNSAFDDATSQADFGVRSVQINDSSIQNSGSANDAGNGALSRLKDPVSKAILTINLNYNIETIKPGDTCVVRNLSAGGVAMFGTAVIRIKRVEYDGLTAVLHLGEIVENYGQELTRSILTTEKT